MVKISIFEENCCPKGGKKILNQHFLGFGKTKKHWTGSILWSELWGGNTVKSSCSPDNFRGLNLDRIGPDKLMVFNSSKRLYVFFCF